MYYPNNSLSDELTNNKDSFTIKAKPFLKNATPLTINSSYNNVSSCNLTVYGKNFFSLNNVYISASNSNMLDNVTLFNPFSSFNNLYPNNPPFHAQVIPSFTQIDNIIQFYLPNIHHTGFLDIIIQNDAGYALLTRDCKNLSLSSNNPFLLLCLSGIRII
jgi:hypothetical protein